MQAEAGGKIEQCFVADGILAWLHIINGKVQEAEEILRSFYEKQKRKVQKSYFRIYRHF